MLDGLGSGVLGCCWVDLGGGEEEEEMGRDGRVR